MLGLAVVVFSLRPEISAWKKIEEAKTWADLDMTWLR